MLTVPAGIPGTQGAYPENESLAPFSEYPDSMERHLKPPTGSKRPYPASSEQKPVVNSDLPLHSVLVTLEECRAVLACNASREAANLVSLAILELRMKLNRVGDSELKALCDVMSRDAARAPGPQYPKPPQGQPLGALLKLVK
jgi:hypothetical protein